MLKITIIYDNTAWLKSLPADWGFACLVEARGKKILFDTGAGDGIVVVAGCAHPGVKAILEAASTFGRVRALVGGMHGFDDFRLIKTLETVCPTHCTRHIQKIKTRFPDAFISGGAGRVISID
jgi:metal-dependent hydrolase (beta-lactamase superfamily II)